MALVAYQEGRFDEAATWAAKADPTAPFGHWVTAKLLLRDGRLDEAVTSMRLASRLLGMEGDHPFHGHPSWYCPRGATALDGGGRCATTELAALQLQSGDPEGALASFLSAGDWFDAAWVAERVLSIEELSRFVQHWYPEPSEAKELRHLLARRLAREGRWDEALRFFPVEVAPHAAELRDLLHQGRDASVPESEQAAALWAAARMTKERGWELLATEVAPDWAAAEGGSRADPTVARLLATEPPSSPFGSTAEERGRLGASRPRPERYQFVYTAWDLADEAASLLPSQTDALAEVLCTSATWMSNRDVERSSQSWYLLRRRAHQTAIGQAAVVGRWWGLGPDGLCVAHPRLDTEMRGGAPVGFGGWLGLALVCGGAVSARAVMRLRSRQ